MAKTDLPVHLMVLGSRLLSASMMEVLLGPSAENPSNSFSMVIPIDQAEFYPVGKGILSTVVK